MEVRSLSQAFTDASPDLIFHKDREGRFISGNQAFLDYWKITPPLVGIRARDFLHASAFRHQSQMEPRRLPFV